MDTPRLKVPRQKIAAFCRKYHVQKLAFFGSILREDFRPTSDVDVLVEFEPGHTPGLAFFGMPEELKAILGREVDLFTFAGVQSSRNPIRRKAILDSAKVYYVAR
jgi:predicted nucleotidyltransferase